MSYLFLSCTEIIIEAPMNKSLIIFGIVNITSDSFSDGGRYLAPDAAIAQARKLMAEGADVIDLGPASSNPDAAPVSSDTEIARIAPVLDALKADGIPVSLDSYQPATQAYALSRGVAYLNDIRGFPDAAFYPQLAKSSAKLVVMHSVQDGQADRREAPAGDIMDHIAAFFDARIAALTGAGIKRNRLVLDPGMGFFLGLLPKPRSRCWRGSMNCGCASICRCFCLFRANPFCARSQAVVRGMSGPRHSLQSLPPPQVELTSSAHTSRAPCATGWRYWRR